MRGLALLLTTFLMMALLSPLLHDAAIAHYVPDLALVACLYIGLTTSLEKAVGWALLIGLLKDGFTTGQTVGMGMEIAVLAALASHRLSRRLVLRGPLGALLLAFGMSLAASLIELGLSLLFVRDFTEGASGPMIILRAMLPQALVTAPFGAIVFWLFDRLDALTSRKNESVFL
jgi:rod shape-determining protein MreD